MTKRALLILSDGFEDVEAVAVIDVLNRTGVNITIASLRERDVDAAYGTTIMADVTLDEVEGTYDAVIFPGGKRNAENLAADRRVREIARKHYDSGMLVAAICAAPSHVLGDATGILKGKRATGDPGFNEKLSKSGAMVTEERVTRDGNIITAEGPGAALEFSLAVARYLVGDEKPGALAKKWKIPFLSAGP